MKDKKDILLQCSNGLCGKYFSPDDDKMDLNDFDEDSIQCPYCDAINHYDMENMRIKFE